MSPRKSSAQSDFNAVLAEALRARMQDEAETGPARRASDVADTGIRDAIEQLLRSPAYVPVGRLARMYAEEQSGQQRLPEKGRDLDQFLADELTLSPDLTVEDLKRLRREFAIYNHPDRVAVADRERATRRMTLVNVLIDRALKEREKRDADAA